MRTFEDVETYLLEIGFPFERLDTGIWRVSDEADHLENIVVYITETVINLRVKLFELPSAPSVELLRTLLELNASEMVHGAYGIEGDAVVVVDALELENLDRNELQAAIDSIGLAVRTHHPQLSALLAG